MSLALDDATRTVVRFFEQNIKGIGIKASNGIPDDLGLPVLSKAHTPEKTGRVMPAPPDPKWIQAHVPSLAFWYIGFKATPDYHIKKKIVEKSFVMKEVKTRYEFYKSRILTQMEMYLRTNYERTLMLAQITSLVNVQSRGTGRISTINGDFIYLKILESRSPQEPMFTQEGVYRLIMTLELSVRELVQVTEPMHLATSLILRNRTTPVIAPKL